MSLKFQTDPHLESAFGWCGVFSPALRTHKTTKPGWLARLTLLWNWFGLIQFEQPIQNVENKMS